jgi:hypothetical protein
MKINFYWEFPYPNIESDILPAHYATTSHLYSAIQLFRMCREAYPDIEFTAIDSTKLNEYGQLGDKQFGPVNKFSHFYVIIENPDNKKYFVISYWDKLRGMSAGTHWDLENMVELFAAIGVQENETDFRPADINYTPISNMCLHVTAEQRIQQVWQTQKSTPEYLYFKGGDYDFRSHVYKDGRIKIDNIRVPQYEFIDMLAKDSIMIDINGASEISHRTFDAFGLGAALIRPKLTIKYHNELIPDYHYAALKCDDLGDWDGVIDAYFERFEDLKKDPELVQFLAANGRKWYEENATVKAHASLLKQLINFDKLK